MPTQNRRVATYLPNEVSRKFEGFKSERGITGDSQALVLILSEFLGVSHQSEVNTNDLEQKLSAIKSELKSELQSELIRIIELQISKLPSELPSNLPSNKTEGVKNDGISQNNSSGIQLDLISLEQKEKNVAIDIESAGGSPQSDFEQVNSLPLESSITIQTNILVKRLGVSGTAISSKKKIVPEQEFYNWLKQKDPNGISWEPVGGDLNARVKGWIPSKGTSSELLSELQKWVATHSHE